MASRRVLLALIAALSVFILCGSVALAGLVFAGLSQPRAADTAELMVLHADRRLTLLRDDVEAALAEDVISDLFRYPTVAPDGEQIAYIGQDADGVTLHRLHVRTGERVELYRSPTMPPLYAAWSKNSRYVSFLVNRPDGLSMYVVAADGSTPPLLLGETSGFSFFSWQPNGEQLLAHIGGSNAQADRVAIFAPDQETPLRELRDPGLFQAPAWSADGASFFYVAQPPLQGSPRPDQIESVITQVPVDGGEPQVIAREPQAALLFVRAPQSDAIAYITISDAGYGALKVAASGREPVVLSAEGQQVSAFFWSPDGARIAYLTALPGSENQARFQWHLVDVASGEIRNLEEFTASPAFAAFVTYFDAYAASFDIWSPQGREVAYGAQNGVYILDVDSGTARRESGGVLGIWVGR